MYMQSENIKKREAKKQITGGDAEEKKFIKLASALCVVV